MLGYATLLKTGFRSAIKDAIYVIKNLPHLCKHFKRVRTYNFVKYRFQRCLIEGLFISLNYCPTFCSRRSIFSPITALFWS